MKTAAI